MNYLSMIFISAFLCLANLSFSMYSVSDEGAWSESWPQELEHLRKQSRTLVGPMIDQQHHEISFTKRKDFEEAWPHILKVKSKGAPIILVRKTEFFQVKPAGVLIHTPPQGQDKSIHPEKPLLNQERVRSTWMWTTYIELVIDGEIVDLNRIPIPSDTPIIDERFIKTPENKSISPTKAQNTTVDKDIKLPAATLK